MKLLKRLENKYGKRRVYGSLGICTILLILGGYFLFSGGDSATDTVTSSAKQVSVEEAGMLGQEAVSLRTIGTVRAISEARLQTESSGRVTSVAVRIGDSVS
ncbi:hypothetical protein K2X96_02690, partial [Patescibacteria group bacterium]|nr:hypothetical protein [Patescibacteria group bacterium]